MEPIKLKKGSPIIYIVLIAVVVFVMLITRNLAHRPYTTNTHKQTAVADTLRVAIQIHPLGVIAECDTLTGFYYELINQIGETHNRHIHIDAFTQLNPALRDLDKCIYDAVIACDTTSQAPGSKYRLAPHVYPNTQIIFRATDTATADSLTAWLTPHITPPIAPLHSVITFDSF